MGSISSSTHVPSKKEEYSETNVRGLTIKHYDGKTYITTIIKSVSINGIHIGNQYGKQAQINGEIYYIDPSIKQLKENDIIGGTYITGESIDCYKGICSINNMIKYENDNGDLSITGKIDKNIYVNGQLVYSYFN